MARLPKVPISCLTCRDTGQVSRVELTLPFNPHSSDQVIELMRHYRLKVPKKRGTDEDTTEAKYLRRYGKKQPLFNTILECRERQKLLTAYMWGLDADDHAHTVYGFHPSNWRKSSRSDNLQTIPTRNSLAELLRRCIVASPGHVLIEGDATSIEAVLVGYCAGDMDYIRVAKAGIHGFTTAKRLGLDISTDLPFDELRRRCRETKKLYKMEYDLSKRGNHGCVTGEHEVLTPRGWVRFDKYDGVEPIAIWSAEGSGQVKFAFPSHIERHSYRGELLHFKGRAFDQMVTPDHALPLSLQRHRIHTLKAKRIAAGDLPLAVLLPCVGYFDGALNPTERELKLVAAVQADGTIKSQRACIKIRKPRKIKRLRELLIGLPHIERPCGDKGDHFFSFPLSHLGEGVKLLRVDKRFTPEVWQLSIAAKQILLDELPHWDGIRSNGKSGAQTGYSTSLYENATIVQTLAYLAGRQCLLRLCPHRKGAYSGRPQYRLSFNRREYVHTKPLKRDKVPHDGMVYCVTVPTHFFLVRYKDTISITGNTNYKLTPYGMHDEFQEQFPTLRSAEEYQEFYFGLFGKIKPWQDSTMQRAHTEHFLDNHFNYRHYFWEVFSWNSRTQSYELGNDAKRAVSFVPSSDASAIQTEDLLELTGPDPQYAELVAPWLRLIIHDSFVADVPKSIGEDAARAMGQVMGRERPELPLPDANLLSIGTEVKIGENLADMTVLETH